MSEALKPLAVVTGASSGIGYELAKIAVENGYDLVIAADRPEIVEAAQAFQGMGAKVDHLQVDLSTKEGVDELVQLIGGRPVDALLANAGHGLGHAFLEQSFEDILHVVNTNITGTIYLVQQVAKPMVQRDKGKILFTGSIAGLMPGTFQAVYNGTKAFIDSFSFALRNELKDTGITVTCLMPGPTDTDFFERAGMEDTKVGSDKKDDPAMVARVGWNAMEKGEGDVVAGFKNKVQAAMSAITPQSGLAEMHRGMAEPGSGQQ
ncbi:SDR family NAD(P)-dependent oxidoreductase [Phenylobacterium deserti]|uniref:Oxidoreductase n=1 Tax=Phenylobacterium deserti TaxID=1914756 RepID=A0A328AQ94_9CAUL|nr:SDR family NAD(P)-dependent oxidoreductase [Phenylobacterium deserti]RAK56757.1 oxidoreductase [Phenylobacterium deserti]